MPIEIRELHIRVTVQSDAGKTTSAQQGPSATDAATGGADKEALIAECVEQVLEVLKAKGER